MIAKLRSFEETKDSGVSWLGEIPKHWRLVPGRACFRQKRLPNSNLRETTVLSLSYGQIVVKPPETLHGLVPSSFETYQIVDQSDIVVRPTDLQNDHNSLRFAISKNRGIITFAYLCLVAGKELVPEYGYLLMHSYDLKKVFYGLGSGLRQNLDWKDFKYLPCLVPSPSEQVEIVRFLDHSDSLIERHIRAKRKLISLLEEQKQAIIHQAVTGEIDVHTGRPYAAYRSSSAEWLQEMPAHWEMITLQRRWRVIDCKHLTVPFVDDGIPLASVREAQSFELNLDLETSNRTTPEWYEKLIEGGRKPRPGDLIYCRNVSVGAAALVATEARFAMGQDVCLIRSSSENQRWLNYFLHSKVMSDQLALILVGSTFNRINVADIKTLLIAVPPVSEQDRIADVLDYELSKIDVTIDTCRREEALLHEYRTRLIADVVTGKLDVRDAGAALPEEDGPGDAEEPADEYTIEHEVTV